MKRHYASFRLVQTFRDVSLRILLFWSLFLGGLVDLYAQLTPLRVERVEYLCGFSQDKIEAKVRIGFEGSTSARYVIDLGKEKWYQKTTILDAFYKPFDKDYIAPWKLVPVGEQDEAIAKY